MAKLIVNPTSPARREVVLSRSLLSIGRDPSNDVVLPDAMVSRRHAVIEYRASQYFLRDCNSSNGSLINGDRVSERGLRDGDLVAIGTARLLFRDDLVAEDAAGKVIHHPSAPRLSCPGCRQDYRRGDQFCRHCGTSLAAASAPARTICSACGTAVPLPARFCTACGSALGDEGRAPAAEAEPAAAAEPGEPPDEPDPAVEAEPSPAEEVAPAAAEPADPFPSMPAAAPAEPRLEPRAEAGPRLEPLRAVGGPAHAVASPVPMEPERPAPPTLPPSFRPPEPWRDVLAMPATPPLPFAPDAPTAQGRPLPAAAVARLVAAVLDAAIVGAGQLLLSIPAIVYWMNGAPAGEAAADVAFLPVLLSVSLAALAAILGAVYYVYFWGVKGATPGKRLLGLVVQRQDGLQPIGVGRAAVRLMGYGVSGLVFGIGFLMIAFGGSGLHDQIAGTRVVRRQGA